MKVLLLIFFVIANRPSFGEETKIGNLINVVNFEIKGSFEDGISVNSGHRVDFLRGDFYRVDENLAIKIADIIGVKLINDALADKNLKSRRDALKRVYSYSSQLLQMLGSRLPDGKNIVYINSLSLSNDLIKNQFNGLLPGSLVMVDGGGNTFWEAYYDVASEAVEIKFNSDF